jgi:hypothetical protein
MKSFKTRVGFLISYLLQYPALGKAISSFFGLFEVPTLEFIRLMSLINENYYSFLMTLFSKVYGSKIVPINTTSA